METIRGQIESLRVLTDTWGKVVVLHGSDRERADVVGTVLGLREGDTVEAHGVWSTHPRWGRQFKAKEIAVVAPSDAAGAVEWCRGRLPGVGRKIATEMVERWPPPELWEVLRGDYDVEGTSPLVTIRGITHERAHEIAAAYRQHEAERDLMVALKSYGLTDGQCAQVVQAYGAAAPQRLREDPYALIDELHGWGWKRADALALRMGLPADHPGRVRACLEWMLGEAKGAGHVYVPAGKLVAMVARELSVPPAAVKREANVLLDAGRLVLRGSAAYRADLAEAEEGVAASVRRLLGPEVAREGNEAA